jgi:hypothetical protein
MSARKTYPVEALVEMVNDICKYTAPGDVGLRLGAMNVLERVLHVTGNYKGFRYLLKGECEGRPGVNYDCNGPLPDHELRFKDTDRTRVQY